MRPFLLFPILQPLQEHPERPLILSALSYTAGDRNSTGRVPFLSTCFACAKMSKIFFLMTALNTDNGNVENNGFEPLTPCLQSRCSSQLS